MTLGKRIKFMTLENVCYRKATTLFRGLTSVRKFYGERAYDISKFFMDNNFETLAIDMKGFEINLNTTAADKHVFKIEHQI